MKYKRGLHMATCLNCGFEALGNGSRKCKCGYNFPYHPDQDVMMTMLCKNCRTINNYEAGYRIAGQPTPCPVCNNGALMPLSTKEEWENFSPSYRKELINSIAHQTLNEKFSKDFLRSLSNENSKKINYTCPTCNSTHIYKISSIDRAMSFGFWGFASSKLGKTMGCNKCGYKW